MLGSCEKMVVIPSTTHEWPQNQVNEKGLIMASSSSAAATTRVMMMEKPNSQEQHQQQQQQQPLKCPRCDSSNTKFCYYNNYSLSQPRHFCKACKRYWTRGGTLRNVPVGGGCRKNKRVKRPNPNPNPSSASSELITPSSTATTNPTTLHHHHYSTGAAAAHLDLSPSPSHHINPLFYSLLSSNPSDLNLPYPTFNSRVSNIDSSPGTGSFDLQMNGGTNTIGLGFSSSGFLVSDLQGSDYRNQNQEVVSTNNNSFLSAVSNSYPILGSQPLSTTTTTTTNTTMASLIASTLQHQKLINSLGANNIQEQQLGSNYEDVEERVVEVPRNAAHHHHYHHHALMVKDVKMEDIGHHHNSRLDMSWNPTTTQNHMEQINSMPDASLLWNATTTTGVGAWLDPSNMGSSVPSLI